MAKFKKLILETTYSVYTTEKLIGEGGSGVVFAARDESEEIVAAKVLDPAKANSEKRKRFKNEINFCSTCHHPNIVPILDRGVLIGESGSSPFYIMPLYDASLRTLIDKGIAPTSVLGYFAQIMEAVQAVHSLGSVHRDLKPENILYGQKTNTVVLADFGIARFSEEIMLTAVETSFGARLANFQYAAPEQRIRGGIVDLRADIYALGLILNEMYTKQLAIGTDYTTIGVVSPQFAYLDGMVAQMLQQNPEKRPSNIQRVKQELSVRESEFTTNQRLKDLKQIVIQVPEIDDPLISDPPRLTDFDWEHGKLTLILNVPPTPKWIQALHNMGNFEALWGKGPDMFHFAGNKAIIAAQEGEVQDTINYFKGWLPKANRIYEEMLRRERQEIEATERNRIKQEIEEQERRLRILQQVKI